jgi:hypothetical protein
LIEPRGVRLRAEARRSGVSGSALRVPLVFGSPTMDPRWLVLSLALCAGCSQASHVEVPYEPSIKTDTSFANLPRILAAIPKSGSMRLYRGLPSEFWEPGRRAQELCRAKTIRLHGYPFYEESIPIPEADAGRLTASLSSRATFRRRDGNKRCSGYSPEYGIECKAGEDGIRALICLECAEVKMFVPKCELYCDLSPEAKQSLESSLSRCKLVDSEAVASEPAIPPRRSREI